MINIFPDFHKMKTVTVICPPQPPGFNIDRESAAGLGLTWTTKDKKHPKVMMPSLTLLYAAAIIEKMGYDTKVIYADAEEYDIHGVVEHLRKDTTDIVCIQINFPSLKNDLLLCNLIKQAFPSTIVFVFGNVIKTTFEQWIDTCQADYLIYGESEEVLPKFIDANSEDERREAGCYSVSDIQKGNIKIASKDWKMAPDLDELPFPAWHLLPQSVYNSQKYFYIGSGRGCSKYHNNCPYVVYHGGLRRNRTPGSIVEEISYLYNRFDAKQMIFRDPNPISHKSWFIEVFKKIISKQLPLQIWLETELEQFDLETLELCKKAGVHRISTGIESAWNACLTEIGKDPDNLNKIRENYIICNRLGIEIQGYFMIGFANDSWDSVSATLSFIKEFPFSSFIHPIMPYFGTQLREEALATGRLTGNEKYEDFNESKVLMPTKYLSIDDVYLAKKYMESDYTLDRLLKIVRDKTPWIKVSLGPILIARLIKYFLLTQFLRFRIMMKPRKSNKSILPISVGRSN